MQTLRKKTSPCKYRNDPGRFFGDGVQFKAKLIGILEVGEARGDRMCQEALQDLKMAIRAAGEHKQRITIHVTIEGLRLRDEKTGDSLYHHPVHKISFIAQDMTDSRAFGYIFGSPDSGHRFFGIKTDKAASQVVLAMRDLFQVVFELKKKEIELARQQIQSKSIHDHLLASLSSIKSVGGHNDLNSGGAGGSSSLTMLGGGGGSSSLNTQSGSSMSRLGVNLEKSLGAAKEMSPESVADLVDLEQELSSIQQGITQMERITPNEPGPTHIGGMQSSSQDEDPFGDSFTTFPTYNLLPPPESGRSRKPNKPPDIGDISSLLSSGLAGSPATLQQQVEEDSWLNELDQQNDVFDTTKTITAGGVIGLGGVNNLPMAPLAPSESTSTPTQQLSENSTLPLPNEDLPSSSASATAVCMVGDIATATTGDQTQTATVKTVISDAFTDLDPLGIGRTRPYVDKKYFFQELKNPPKKVLKELSNNGNTLMDISSNNYIATAAAVVDEFLSKEGLFDDTISRVDRSSPLCDLEHQYKVSQQQQLNVSNSTNTNNSSDLTQTGADTNDVSVMLPRDTDPFSPTRKKSDPFQEGGDVFAKLDDPFEFGFESSSKKPGGDIAKRTSPSVSAAAAAAGDIAESRTSSDVFNGPLQVSLPPENNISPTPPHWKADITRLDRSSDMPMLMGNGISSTVRSRPTPSGQLSSFQHQTVDVISSISNKKMPHLFGQAARFSKRDSNSINMRRLQESDSLSENETAPEPPPRPDSVSHIEPPPLPPKKQFTDLIIRPRFNQSTVSIPSRYEYVNPTKLSSSHQSRGSSDVPPIPLPSRRVGRSDGTYPGPGRPRKPGHTEDDYLAPISVSSASSGGSCTAGDVPPLLPPPMQVSTRTTRAQRQHSLTKAQQQEIYENKTEILQQQQQKNQPEQEQQQQQHIVEEAIIPNITLSQLLTLGIDELATKLNVPTSKLSTMTLVELTSYLSEFLEISKPSAPQKVPLTSPSPTRTVTTTKASTQIERRTEETASASVFKVNFDQQVTFVAKFDDTFGEETFVANFEKFNEPPTASTSTKVNRTPAIPPADRYAVFREIIDQELQYEQEAKDLMGDITPPPEEQQEEKHPIGMQQAPDEDAERFEANFDEIQDGFASPKSNEKPVHIPPKIDTKITEVVAQAKDRYAALRDIILVEKLFDSVPTIVKEQEKNLMREFPEFSDEFNEDQDLKQIMDERVASSIGAVDRLGLVDSRGFPMEPSSSAITVDDDESSLDSNEKDGGGASRRTSEQDRYEKLSTSTQQLDIVDKTENYESNSNLPNIKLDSKFLTVASSSGLSSSKDDLEIDELMQRAISNLSFNSRERISPAVSINGSVGASTPAVIPHNTVIPTLTMQSQFNDVSTSPIPLQKSPMPQHKSHTKSPLTASPILSSQLSAVSQLIDTASKNIGASDFLATNANIDKMKLTSKETWATFDSPKTAAVFPDAETLGDVRKRSRPNKSTTSLHLPPPPPSNTSQNDTAESPCSSDPRDDTWAKGRWQKKERQHTSSSSRDLSPWDDEIPPDYQKQKRIPPMQIAGISSVQDRHNYYMRHARRMNSCDEDYDYEEPATFNSRRDQRKIKQGISRSRDNFDLDSPSWFHHHVAVPHHTWSPQDIEQSMSSTVRGPPHGFERSGYERTTYGPPIYDKRGVALPPSLGGGSTSSYDRRTGGGGGYDKRKYYRDYTRPSYDFDEYGESPPPERYEKLKLGRRSDYENIYDDGRSPDGRIVVAGGGIYKARGGPPDYMYEQRERKSFDRESVESYESVTRRRRSFGSGDVYGSLESREEFRDRYMGGGEKTRSLRKGMKMRGTGDIDYEQDSENDFLQRPMRSLQRPTQLSGTGTSGSGGGLSSLQQQRIRKSSGSSPWDGEEPSLPGQKSWKRPSSAAEPERRQAESRRGIALGLGQAPPGSDGEKDRRFRKKQRVRKSSSSSPWDGEEPSLPGQKSWKRPSSAAESERRLAESRRGIALGLGHTPSGSEGEKDRSDIPVYDAPPMDEEDKFERLNRRRHEMHQIMLESERRQHALSKQLTKSAYAKGPKGGKNYHNVPGSDSGVGAPRMIPAGGEYNFDDHYQQTPTPRSNASSIVGMGNVQHLSSGGSAAAGSQLSFDGGFESDFNQSSPPPAPAGTASSCNSTPAATISATPGTKSSSFRFSNDFSEREKLHALDNSNIPAMSAPLATTAAAAGTSAVQQQSTPSITQKLRFDDNVKISQFDDASAFEDDFSNAQFEFDKEQQHQHHQWQMETNAAARATAAAASSSTKKQNIRNSKLQQRQELIKKSESINIFGKKSEDPFEDDEFFKAAPAPSSDMKIKKPNQTGNDNNSGNGSAGSNKFQWDDDESNFAKFDENM